MKIVCRVLPVLLLMTLSVVGLHARAHDVYGATAATSMGASQSRQYNPWRPVPARQWGTYKQHTATVQQQPGYTPSYVVPMSPILARQYEYQHYVQQVNPYSGNGRLPWWADQTSMPYGPWAIDNGWPNGLR